MKCDDCLHCGHEPSGDEETVENDEWWCSMGKWAGWLAKGEPFRPKDPWSDCEQFEQKSKETK
ncbi:hypothetical protein F0L74_09905 [Chitinophaga agrisoli]|uniref:Uncharacterized protein n=1 Tax=Chitinophaga agrisoli TaxID=2607653 RepID=A0A5B2VSS3_9BACT|nr:hypothetical protein [Chitinophaga agrisoli]KAA2242833.1 hypothetical protein F0L74_09905 [Chitinophaga agrisoli]